MCKTLLYSLSVFLPLLNAWSETTLPQRPRASEVNIVNDTKLLISSINFSRLVGERLGAAQVLKPSVTGAGLLYQFEGLKAGGRLSAVIAVYATEGLAQLAMERQITMTSVSSTKREPTDGGELVLWETGNPMFGSMMLRHKNVVVRLLNGISWSNRLALIAYLDQAFHQNTQEVSRSSRVVPPEIQEPGIPAIVHPGESFEVPLELKNIAAASALLGSDDTAVTLRSGEKPMFAYRAEKAGSATVILIIASPGNVISKTEITITVR